MTAGTKIYKKLASDIIDAISGIVANAKFNQTVKGRVTASLGNGKYKVLISGKSYTVRSHFSHSVNDVVAVIICNHDWNDLYVIY